MRIAGSGAMLLWEIWCWRSRSHWGGSGPIGSRPTAAQDARGRHNTCPKSAAGTSLRKTLARSVAPQLRAGRTSPPPIHLQERCCAQTSQNRAEPSSYATRPCIWSCLSVNRVHRTTTHVCSDQRNAARIANAAGQRSGTRGASPQIHRRRDGWAHVRDRPNNNPTSTPPRDPGERLVAKSFEHGTAAWRLRSGPNRPLPSGSEPHNSARCWRRKRRRQPQSALPKSEATSRKPCVRLRLTSKSRGLRS